MAHVIQAVRPEVNRNFPLAGFRIRSDTPRAWGEVAIAVEPDLLVDANARTRRTTSNFYSSRATGAPFPIERGEATWLVPPEVMARFAGQSRLYYALAVYADANWRDAQVTRLPAGALPYVNISRSFTGQAYSILGLSSRRNNVDAGGNYGGSGAPLEWGGDSAVPGEVVALPAPGAAQQVAGQTGGAVVGSSGGATTSGTSTTNGAGRSTVAAGNNGHLTNGNGVNGNGANGAATGPTSMALAEAYDDGFSADLWRRPTVRARALTLPDPSEVVYDVVAGQEYGPRFRATQPPGLPNYARLAGGPNSADPWIEQIAGDLGLGQTFVSTVRHLAQTESGSQFARPANIFDARPKAQRPADKPLITAWGCFQFNRDAWRSLPGVGADEFPWDSTPFDELNRPIQQYAGLFREVVAAGGSELDGARGMRLWHRSPVAYRTYVNSGGRGSFEAAWAAVEASHRNAVDRHLREAGTLAQGLAMDEREVRVFDDGAHSAAFEVVDIYYQPTDTAQAVAALAEFSARRVRWEAGVDDASFFPHSAICQLFMTFPDGVYSGTGFYIGRNTILTCAHNVRDTPTSADASQIEIRPGRNGSAQTAPTFTVSRSAWDYHPQYDGGNDFDLAVIRVPGHDAPNGQWFDYEDFPASPNGPVIVCGYSARVGDRNKQKLDGDIIREVSDNLERIMYNLQTTKGASGSPCFYIGGYEDEQRQQSVSFISVIGVHVANFDNTLNEACRISAGKLRWIQSVSQSGASSMALSLSSPKSMPMAAPRPARLGQSLNAEPFVSTAIDRFRTESKRAATAAAATCIGVTNTALRALYGSALQNADGSRRTLGTSIQDTMAALQGYGLADAPTIVEFNDAQGRLTRGVARPDTLRESVAARFSSLAGGSGHRWCVYGLSLMDGYHSVLIAAEFQPDGSVRIYWCDQIYGGWDDATGDVDARITRLIQRWWDPLPANRKARTRVTIWPLRHSMTSTSQGMAQGMAYGMGTAQGTTRRTAAALEEAVLDDIEGNEAEDSLSQSFSSSCVDECTDTFCTSNPAATAGSAHFTMGEFRCADGTEVPERFRGSVQQVMDNLEVLRSDLGDGPITIISGYRTCSHNCTLSGAARNSRHLCGQAADIRVQGYTPAQVKDAIERLIAAGQMRQGGVGLYATFVHYDVRGTRARW